MTNLCEYLQWDSDFFGFRIGRVVLGALTDSSMRAIEQWSADNRIDCLYHLSGADDLDTIGLAEDRGFRLVDIRVIVETTRLRTDHPQAAPAPVIIRPSRESDVDALSRIAACSHRITRFYADPRLRAHGDEFYRVWVENSCRGWAQHVVVADLDGQPVGYTTCHLDADGSGRLGLIAVATEFHGQGLGRLLISQAITWLAQQGVPRVTVVTQARNIPVHRLFGQMGFLVRSVDLWHHRWFTPPENLG